MMKLISMCVLAFGLAFSVRAVVPLPPMFQASGGTSQVDSVIIVLKDDAAVKKDGSLVGFAGLGELKRVFAASARTKKSMAAVSVAERNLNHMYSAKVADGASVAEVLMELKASSRVEYAEPDWPLELCAAPNDEHFNPEQWSLNNTGQLYHTGTTPAVTNGASGADIGWLSSWERTDFPTNEILIAVVDTGVDYTHRDLTNQMWRNPGEAGALATNGVDDDANGYVDDVYGVDIYNTDSDPMDDHLHGTHVAGTIGAETDNGYGMAGICPSAKIMAVKIFSHSGSGSSSDGIAAIRYAADMGAKVINNSWGGGGYLQSLQDAITYANELGAVVVCAAGNNNSGIKMYPAGYKGSLAVAASDSEDQRARFSNYGRHVDVTAPGVSIFSLLTHLGDPDYGVLDDDFLIISGTSMACPTTAGAMGLLMSTFPGHEPWVYEKVMEKACDTNFYSIAANTNFAGMLGAGRIRVEEMLDYDGTNAFLDTSIELNVGFGRSFLGAGETGEVVCTVGAWEYPLSNLNLRVSSLTTGIVLNVTNYFIGNMAAAGVTNIPDETFFVGVKTNAEWNSVQRVLVELVSGDRVLDQDVVAFQVFSGEINEMVTYDLDGDGQKEVIGSHYSVLTVFNEDGTLRWFHDMGGYYAANDSAVAVGDVDGDGKGEVVLTVREEYLGTIFDLAVYVFEDDGSLNARWPIHVFEGGSQTVKMSAPALADVDGDEVLDILWTEKVDGFPAYSAMDSNGDLLSRSVSTNSGFYITSPAVGDVDGDGTVEMVAVEYKKIGTDRWAQIVVRREDGSLRNAIRIEEAGPTPVKDFYFSIAPVIADIDFDGKSEILVTGLMDGNAVLVAYHEDGTPVSGYPVDIGVGSSLTHPPTLADVDDDGDLEIFLFRPDLQQILGLDHTGATLPAFPITDANAAEANQKFSGNYQPIVADVDGDGSPDIIYAGNYTSYAGEDDPYSFVLTARDMNGLMIQGFPKVLEGTGSAEAYPQFYVHAGSLGEGVFSTNQYIMCSVGAELFQVDTGAPYNPSQQHWPSYARDERRSYCYRPFQNRLKAIVSCTNRYGIHTLNADFSATVHAAETNGLYYRWDFENDGTTDVEGFGLRETSHLYDSTGVYSVLLTCSNDAGETVSVLQSNFIHVLPEVVADFSASPTNMTVAPIGVYFTDQSENLPQTWLWNFGDGSSSTEQNPMHVYTNAGDFSVTLTVGNDFADAGASSNTIIKTDLIQLSTTQAITTVRHVWKGGSHSYPFKNWAEAATNILSAVEAAVAGDTVLVTNGIYKEGVVVRVKKDITLQSVNGPLVTVIDGDTAHRCAFVDSTNAVLEGFTLKDGRSTIAPGCLIAKGFVKNCIIKHNQTVGYFFQSTGGIKLSSHDAYLLDSQIISNRSIVVGGVGSVNGTIRNCILQGNEGYSGSSAARLSGDAAMYNSLVTGNTGGESAVALVTGGNLYNSTLTENTVSGTQNGALFIEDDGARLSEIFNVLSFGNSGNDVAFENLNQANRAKVWNCSMAPAITHLATDRVLDQLIDDPEFVDAAEENYRLQTNSPCIDSGYNMWAYSKEDVRKIKIDFGTSAWETPGNWNNVTNLSAGEQIANLIDTNATATGISLSFVTNFNSIGVDGVHSDALYPTNAQKDYLMQTNTPFGQAIPVLQFDGMSTGKQYSFTFFASHTTSGTSYERASFRIGDTDTDWYSSHNNTNQTVVLEGHATTNGTLIVNMRRRTVGDYPARLGVLEIEEYTPISSSPLIHMLDLDGNPRIDNGTVDIGAYEAPSNRTPVVSISASAVTGKAPLSVSFAATADDPDGSITNYIWSFGNGAVANGASLSAVTNLYAEGGLFLATVTAQDNHGAEASASVAIHASSAVPNAPSGFSATNTSTSSIDLSWLDQADDETAFVLERQTRTRPFEIILDNTDTEYVQALSIDGPAWSTATSVDDHGANYLRRSYSQNYPNGYSVSYTPELPETGWVEIFEWHPALSTAGQGVPLQIIHKSGTAYRYVDQTINGGQWNSIGTYFMENGNYVRVSPDGVWETAIADAFKFVRVGAYEPLTTLGADAEEHSDSGLTDDRTYSYRIAASNQYGQSSWVEAQATIPSTNLLPIASIDSLSPTSGIPDLVVNATGSASDPDGSVTNYLWNFGDGYSGSIQSGATLTNASYIYRNIGLFDVTLTVFDNKGYSTTVTNSVNVYGAVPNPPTDLSAQNIADTYVSVTWDDNAYNEERLVLQRQTASGPFSDLVELGEAAVSHNDTDVVLGTTYGYRARTENVHGTSDWSNVGGVIFGDTADFTLPFEESFDALTLGDLDGQHGWVGDGTVQTGTVYEGTQALALTNGTASHLFISEATNIWVTFWAQPTLSDDPPEDIPTNAAAVFYVNASTNIVAYDSTNATVISSATFSNGWNEITVSCDFISKVWNLSLNNVPRVGNFAFYGSPASFQALEIIEGSESNAFFDSITVSDTSDESDPSDTDADGLPDRWEEQYWPGDLSHNPGDIASNGVDTVWATYIAGLDPTSPTNRFLSSVLCPPSSDPVLRWNSVSGRVYSVYWTSNLLSNFQPLETNLPWTEMPYTDTNESATGQGFYKIDVELE